MTCPCGLPATYDACCGRFHRGAPAPTAELLMRSRYTAFALGDTTYLAHSWHPSTRPRRIHLGERRTWTRLEVISTSGGGMLDPSGTVEFRAHHRDGDDHQEQAVHELSAFERHDGRWVYVAAVD